MSGLRGHALVGAVLAMMAVGGAIAAPAGLDTHAERTGFVETGRYAEVGELCAAFARRFPDAVRCERFGTTPEGRPLLVLVASTSGALDPAQAKARGLPVVLVQGGIHAGEIDGKDAGFGLLRDILQGTRQRGVLDRQVLLFVPVFNADGHERFKAWNRPNQRGPVESGVRATGQNYNLNRDYVKADAPEMQAMLRLVGRWDPILVADLHVTNGAKFQHDVAIQVEPLNVGDAGLARAGKALSDALLARHAARGGLPLPYYPTLLARDDPSSGFAANVYPPRFSTGYFPMRNRFTVLVETHAWKPYAQRVAITRDLVGDMLALAGTDGRDWLALAATADRQAADIAGTRFALGWTHTGEPRLIDFAGYAYTRERSDVSGDLWTRYDETRPQVWRVPLYEQLRPEATADLPRGGYVVEAAHADRIGALLDLHGIAHRRIDARLDAHPLETRRIAGATISATPFEGRHQVKAEGQWSREARDLPAGALYVPLAQPASRLVASLFEPNGPDSLLAWGFFNAIFERKEYVAAYVAEEIAREMLQDTAVAAEFRERLASDAAFAASPAQRLEFFTRRHASWEERYGLYPVYRVQAGL